MSDEELHDARTMLEEQLRLCMKLDAKVVRLRTSLEGIAGDLLLLSDALPYPMRSVLKGLSDRAWRIAKESWE